MRREREQERWTSLDRTLQREASDDCRVRTERFNEPTLQRQRLLLIGRLQRLQRLGLADETQPGTWAVHADAEKTLRALGERGDIIRTMQRAMSGQPRELAVFEPGEDGRTVIGRVAAKGLTRRTARPRLSGHRRRGRQGPLRRVERPRRAGELSHRRSGGGARLCRGAGGRQEHCRAGERWPVPHRSSPGDRAGPNQAWTRSAGGCRGPRPQAGSPAPGWHRGARGKWTMEGAGRFGRAWPPLRRTTAGRRSGGAEIALTHRAAGPRDRRNLARPTVDRRRQGGWAT